MNLYEANKQQTWRVIDLECELNEKKEQKRKTTLYNMQISRDKVPARYMNALYTDTFVRVPSTKYDLHQNENEIKIHYPFYNLTRQDIRTPSKTKLHKREEVTDVG